MKENILYAYHIDIEEIEEHKDYSVFQIENTLYYFTKLKRTEKEFQELLQVYYFSWRNSLCFGMCSKSND